MNQLQTVLDALENGIKVRNCAGGTKYQPPLEAEAVAIVKQMMQAKPVAWRVWETSNRYALYFNKYSADRSGEVQTPRTYAEPLYSAPQASPEWQKIESAPRDGTRILLRGYGATFVAGFEKVIGCDFYGWVVANDIHIEPKHASHWMPLPSAPKDTP